MRPFIPFIGLVIALSINYAHAQSCVSYANSVSLVTGNVTNQSNSTGSPNSTVATLATDNDLIVWNMGSVLPAGTQICVRVKKATSGGSAFDFRILSGADGINVTTGSYTQLGSYTELDNSSFTDKCVTLTSSARYIKVIHEDESDFHIDAVTATITVNAGSTQTVCANSIVSLSASPSNGTWTKRSSPANPNTNTTFGNASSASTTVSGLTNAGTYGFIWTVGSCSDTVLIAVSAKPNAGTDKTVSDIYGSTAMTATAVSGGKWSEVSSNPGLSEIDNTSSATTTIGAFSASGVYQYIWKAGSCADTVKVTVGSCACANNKVDNSSFESPTDSDVPSSWTATPTFAAWRKHSFAAQCSDHAAQMDGTSNTNLATFYQDETVSAGTSLTLKFKAGTHNTGDVAKFGLVFYNGSTELSSNLVEVDHVLGDGTMLGYTITATAPPSTTKVRVIGKVGADWLKVDLVCLTFVSCSSAGTNGSTSVCDNSTSAISLSSLITDEATGGVWSRATGTGGTFVAASGMFTPAVGTTTSTFRYILTGSGGCPNDTSIATVTLNPAPNAGTNGGSTVCNNSSVSIDLFSLITGEQTGGAWSKVTGSGANYSDGATSFVPNGANSSYVFRYVKTGTGGCANDTSFATVTVSPAANAGDVGSTVSCNTSTTSINLFNLISNEAAGGIWSKVSGSGASYTNGASTFVPSGATTNYVFRYIVTGTSPCPNDTSFATVNITTTPNAGTDGNTTVCSSSTSAINLFSLITGEITGGVWSRATGSGGTFVASSGTFTPATGATTSTFKYILASSGCASDTSIATVNITAIPNAGTNGSTEVCERSSTITLASLITGEASGGTWSRVSGSNGVFDAAAGKFTPNNTATTSVFRYVITGTAPCSNDTSLATVNVLSISTPAIATGTPTTCINTVSQFCAVSESNIQYYEWDFGSGASPSTSKNRCENVQWTTAGTKTIKLYLISNDDCNSDTISYVVNVGSCCTGRITGIFFNKMDGGTDIPITNGSSFNVSQIANLYNIEANTSGTIGSVVYTITGPTASSNTENSGPYNAPGTDVVWNPSAGSYSINAKAYSSSGAGGTLCHDTTFTFTLNTTGSIGDYVWLDSDGDGQQEGDEHQLPGIIVTLTKPDNSTVKDTTDSNGKYLFTGLAAGTYSLSFGLTSSYIATTSNSGSDNSDSDINSSGVVSGIVLTNGQNNLTIDAGLKSTHCDCTASTNNKLTNGSFETGNTTGWSATNGSLTVGSGYQMCGSKNAFLDHSSGIATAYQEVNVSAGSTINLSAYAGTHTGGQNCSPWLKLIYLNASGVSLKRDSLDIDKDVDKPDYLLKFLTISGVAPTGTTKVRVEATITCDVIKLDAFCLTVTAPSTGSIGNFVWHDFNSNGIQENGEPGIDGATVILTKPDASTVSTTTSGGGTYIFTGLVAGTYSVSFTTPSGFTVSPTNKGNDAAKDSDPIGGIASGIILASGQVIDSIDAGFYKIGSIGNFVWNDTNGNGVQDGGESGIDGATVILTKPDASTVSTTTTGGGIYNFNGLAPGTYSVSFTTPSGFTNSSPSNRGGDPTKDSDPVSGVVSGIVLTSGQVIDSIDAGFYKLGSIGNFVWHDLNANGVQDGGESGIDGATVILTKPDASTVSATTAGGGSYNFTGLVPGTYSVSFTTPSGYTNSSPSNQGGNSTKDSDPISGVASGIVLTSGQVIDSIDAGFYKLGSIGNFVWHDLNANGVQEGGETGIDGATVTLTKPDASTVSTTTSGGGAYLFSGLIAGTYSVSFTTPSGYNAISPSNKGNDPTKDSDPISSVVSGIVLSSGQTIDSIDAGFYKLGSIGNFVWNDINANGIQDGGETGIDGATVILTRPDASTVSTTTSGGGIYLFNNLSAGTYSVSFTNPSGYTATSPFNQGGDPAKDSDPIGGVVNGIILSSGQTIDSIDAGFYKTASIGNYVWLDKNANGIQETGETGMANCGVMLTNVTTGTTSNTTTNFSGRYMFTGLVPGSYKLTFATPSGYMSSSANTAQDDKDSDAGVGGVTANYTLIGGQVDSTVDAGFFACPGNFTFDPVEICGTMSVNLNSYEPAGYTGGTWTLDGIPVEFPEEVIEGSYLYTKVVGPGCTATGTFVISRVHPDYTPRITIVPGTISGMTAVNVLVDIIEVEDKSSCGTVYALIPSFGERFSFTFNPDLSLLGIFNIANSDWHYMGLLGTFHVWEYVANGGHFPAGGVSKFGFTGMYNNQGTSGETRFTIEIAQGSGGETNFSNNSDGETLYYRRKP